MKLPTLLYLFALLAYAKEPRAYQDAVLMGFDTVATGARCAYGRCRDVTTRNYSVSFGEHVYVVEPGPGLRASNLARQPVGSHVSAASDGVWMWIKIGDKESKFSIVGIR